MYDVARQHSSFRNNTPCSYLGFPTFSLSFPISFSLSFRCHPTIAGAKGRAGFETFLGNAHEEIYQHQRHQISTFPPSMHPSVHPAL